MQWCSSSAISFPRASAVLSTCLASTGTPASSVKSCAAFLEADHGTHRAHHACEGGRERGVFYTQMLIARIEAVAAGRTVIVGALEL